jgi:hypothetical protein
MLPIYMYSLYNLRVSQEELDLVDDILKFYHQKLEKVKTNQNINDSNIRLRKRRLELIISSLKYTYSL